MKEFNFVGAPLWRLSDGRDLVRVELTFHKNQPTKLRQEKAECRRQPASSAGEWPRQPTAVRPQTTTSRSLPARRQPTMEKETSPPAVQTLQTSTSSTIRHQRKPYTAEITRSPIIMRPTTPPPSPESPPSKKQRPKSPKCTRQPKEYFHVDIEDEYPLHEKYDLQDIYATTHKVIVKASGQPREDKEINIDLPAYFVFHREKKHWLIKGPTSNFFDDPWYTTIEMRIKANSIQQTNTVRCPGRIRSRSLRGGWRTTTTSARAAKLPWHDLL